MKVPKWKRKLTETERKHIADTTASGTLAQFKLNRESHLKLGPDQCHECQTIASKLGLK